ncbi:MAG TPA: ROK family protein, partial [Dermatophilaceae bacterium]|nr:ROK family protein [Dermatophilaceae bacterium]
MSEPVLALDIGGTKIAAALVTGGHVGEVCRVATPASQGPEAVVAAAVAVAKEARGESRPVLVGIGSAGVIDSTNGVVTHATDALPGWAGTPLARGVSEGLGLAAYALNDVHAHALGEASFGAG